MLPFSLNAYELFFKNLLFLKINLIVCYQTGWFASGDNPNDYSTDMLLS